MTIGHPRTLTYTPFLEPRKGLQRIALRVPVKHPQVALAIDGTLGTPQLDRHDDKPDKPEDEDEECAYHDDGGEQPVLGQ